LLKFRTASAREMFALVNGGDLGPARLLAAYLQKTLLNAAAPGSIARSRHLRDVSWVPTYLGSESSSVMDAALAKDFQGVRRYNRLLSRPDEADCKQLWGAMAVNHSAAIFCCA